MAEIELAPFGDEFLKNTFATDAFDQFEIAHYLRSPPTSRCSRCAAPLEQSPQLEQRMAEWVHSNVGKVTEFVRAGASGGVV